MSTRSYDNLMLLLDTRYFQFPRNLPFYSVIASSSSFLFFSFLFFSNLFIYLYYIYIYIYTLRFLRPEVNIDYCRHYDPEGKRLMRKLPMDTVVAPLLLLCFVAIINL